MDFEDKEIHDGNSGRPQTPPSPGELDTEAPLTMRKPKYKECLKNHAVGIGSHAVDGCGEFMAAGEEGTLESFKCAACNCHRNFHRKHIVEITTTYPLLTHHPYNHFPPPPYHHHHHHQQQLTPLALPSTSEQNDMSNGGKKRFRTKFSQEQKMKMQELAEKIGWRIQRQDDSIVQQFCDENGVKRNVFKVWMHNNKHTLGKNLSLEPSNLNEAAEQEN